MTSSLGRFVRRHWIDVLWWLFVIVNAIAILIFREWETVPFHFIWIGLSLMYGWRVWSLPVTFFALASVVAITGLVLLKDVALGGQAPVELSEIPLMSTVFVVMVWYVRRHVAATQQIRVVSERNLAMLNQQRHFVQDASHVLRTPLTIALGHTELLLRTVADPEVTSDLRVVAGELQRLKTISDRLLKLAATEQPDFLLVTETSLFDLITRAWSRWSSTTSGIRLGPVFDEAVGVDPALVSDAVDEMISNAVEHTPPGTPITVSATRRDGWIVIAVADQGPGIAPADRERIFERFAQVGDKSRGKHLGLGLALVKAIAEAHGGSVSVRGGPGDGSVFELRLPAMLVAQRSQPSVDAATGALRPVREAVT